LSLNNTILNLYSEGKMKLCRVVGNIQSTIKHQAYKGQKIMVVQPLDETLKEDGQTFLSVERALK